MLNGAGSTRAPLIVSVANDGLEGRPEPAVRGHGASAALEQRFGVKLPAAPREEDEAGGALHDAVDAPRRLGEAEAPQPHLVALRGLDLEVEPADARDVGLRFDRDWLVVRVEEFEVAHRELADAAAARRVVRCLGELSDAEEKEEAEQKEHYRPGSAATASGSLSTEGPRATISEKRRSRRILLHLKPRLRGAGGLPAWQERLPYAS